MHTLQIYKFPMRPETNAHQPRRLPNQCQMDKAYLSKFEVAPGAPDRANTPSTHKSASVQ